VKREKIVVDLPSFFLSVWDMKKCEKEGMMMMFIRMGGGAMDIREVERGGKGRSLGYHEETSSKDVVQSSYILGIGGKILKWWGWWLLKRRHSLCMMARGEWKGKEERYLNMLLDKKLGVEKMRKFGVVVKLRIKGKGLPSYVARARRTRT